VFKEAQERMTDGRTIREFEDRIELRIPTKAWFIDVPDLTALMRLMKREGGKIIVERDPLDRHPSITIYDDYVE
jgi:hypothetical protein